MSQEQHMDSVLQTVELLENILAQLDLRTLLVSAQRVNRRWHEVITQSPRLQEALFFNPAAFPQVVLDSDATRLTSDTDLGSESGKKQKFEPEPEPDEPVTAAMAKAIRINPLLAEVFPFCFPQTVDNGGGGGDEPPKNRGLTIYGNNGIQSSRLGRDEKHRIACMHPDATWRRMLVQQPPIHRLGHWYHTHAMGGDGHDVYVRGFPGGLRMDFLYDQAIRMSAGAAFAVLWGDPWVGPQSRDWSRGRRLSPEQRERVDGFCRTQRVVLQYSVTFSCCVRSRSEKSILAELALTHPRSGQTSELLRELEKARNRTDSDDD